MVARIFLLLAAAAVFASASNLRSNDGGEDAHRDGVESEADRELVQGGTVASRDDYGYAVQLHVDGKFLQSGVMLSTRHVITASSSLVRVGVLTVNSRGVVTAHPERIRVYVANKRIPPTRAAIRVSAVWTPPNFNVSNLPYPTDHAIAILKLATSTPPNVGAKPAFLNRDRALERRVGTPVLLAGWGMTGSRAPNFTSGANFATSLVETPLKLERREVCNDNYIAAADDDAPFPRDNICTVPVSATGGAPCIGDQGAGLVIQDPAKRDKYTLLGVVYFVTFNTNEDGTQINCRDRTFRYTFYVSVAQNYDWIVSRLSQ